VFGVETAKLLGSPRITVQNVVDWFGGVMEYFSDECGG
jgi:hypothetical protein